jgi:hypothetical protein
VGIGINEYVALKGGILKYTRSTFGRASTFRRELTDLGSSFWNARYKSALAVDDAGKPARRDITGTGEGEEFLVSNPKCQRAKGLTILEDRYFDSCATALRITSDTTTAFVASACSWASSERANDSASAMTLPSSASTPAAIDRAA